MTPSAMGKGDNFEEFGCHLRNVGEEVTISGDARHRQAGGLAVRWRASAWDLLAVFLVFSARFANFLAGRNYGFLHMEILAAFGFLLLLAALVVLVIALRAEILRPFALVILVVVALHTEIELLVPEALTSHLAPEVATAVESMAFLLPAAVIAWVLRAHISKIVAVVFGVMVLSSILLPQPRFEAITVVEQEQVATTDRGPIIHLILDQQIGIDGLVDAIPGAAEMRGELLTLYENAGFRVYGSAFTHFPATLESLPNLMNNSVQPSAYRWVRRVKGRNKLTKNRWFQYLKAQGYAIEVLQTHYIDFCADPAAPVSRCESYNLGDVRFLHDLDVRAIKKAQYLVLYFFAVDYKPLTRAFQLGWYAIISNYSTLFAVRAPGLAPGLDRENSSIQGLIARQVMGLNDFVDHDDIFLKPNTGVIGPGQKRRPMVVLGVIEDGVRRDPE